MRGILVNQNLLKSLSSSSVSSTKNEV